MTAVARHRERIEVWYDGSCAVCLRSRRWCEHRDRDRRLVFRDFRTADDGELPAARRHHETTMMVRTGSGELLEGFAAWRQILAVLPGYKWLARVAALPLVGLLGSLGYRVVARWRFRLAPSCEAGCGLDPEERSRDEVVPGDR